MTEKTALIATLQKYFADRQELVDRHRRDDPRWALLGHAQDLDVLQLSSVLRIRRQAALSYFVTRSRIVAVLVDGEGCEVGTCERSDSLMSELARYEGNLTAVAPTAGQFDPARTGIDFRSLTPDVLIERALGQETLLISAHGPLHALPWPAIRCGDHRLLELRPVGLLPNLASRLLLDSPITPPVGITLIGAPGADGSRDLLGIRQELTDLENMYGADPTTEGRVERRPATQAAVLDQLGRRDAAVLHLACHGRVHPQWPMDSGLEVTDDFLDCAEILINGVARNEVILSACSSGWRPHRVDSTLLAGDDILGLPGALLEAGASTIMVSIPLAEDAPTRRLNVAYHRGRRSGNSPITALAFAQRQMLAEGLPGWGWCGFVIYGCE